MLHYCCKFIPYYRDREEYSAGFRRGGVKTLPVIDKMLVRGEIDNMTLPGADLNSSWRNVSSGSTGTPLECYFDRYAASVVDKATFYFPMFDRGLRVKDCLGRMSSRELHDWWMDLGFMRERSINIVGDPRASIQNMVKWGVNCLYLSPSFGQTLASANEQMGYPFRSRLTFTSSETLFPPVTELLEQFLGGPVVDTYGSAEFPGVAWTCEEGNYHLIPEQLVEVLDTRGERVSPGETGMVVITSLHNKIMPLIRYNTQDVAIMGENDGCQCGRRWPYIKRIEGRSNDFLVDKNGEAITPMALGPIHKEYRRIKQVKVVQRRRGEATIYVVLENPGDDPSQFPGVRKVMDSLRSRIRFDIEIVDSISGKGNKQRLAESSVKPEW
ncbi:MAG: phenylacetate--CoA ligase family protein [Theionarchaea archaeon]|nr:phenylacetate--CoA ligase family protein [Theionarchaea archaeon]